MNILAISNLCSQKVYTQYVPENMRTSQQAQKFWRLIVLGLCGQCDNVQVLTKMPLPSGHKKGNLVAPKSDCIESAKIDYISTRNTGLFSNIHCFFYTIYYTYRFCKRNKDSFVINDLLYMTSFLASRIGTWLAGSVDIAMITDSPDYCFSNKGLINKAAMRIRRWMMGMPDAYLPISKKMDEIVNKKHKPSYVMEGIADDINQFVKHITKPKFFMYAGSLFNECGVEKFAKAFSNSKQIDWELHVYGDGVMRKEIESIAENDNRIKLFGVKQNEIVMNSELSATVLINPRVSNADFNNFTFPSKTMEYMTTGTTVLTTRLAGIPEEYFKYVLVIENETIEGMQEIIEEITSKPDDELQRIGQRGRQFVVENKGTSKQALNIINLYKMSKNQRCSKLEADCN